VLALPLAAELVSVRAFPVGALQNLVQRVALVLDLRGTGLQLAAEILELSNICAPIAMS